MALNFNSLPNFVRDCSRHCACVLARGCFCFVLWDGVFLLCFLGVWDFPFGHLVNGTSI